MTSTGIGRADGEPGKLGRPGQGRNHLADAPGAPSEGASPSTTSSASADEEPRRGLDPLLRVRASDLEPYTGLGYLSKLFRVIAVLLLALLVAEVVAGLASDDPDKWRTLLSEVSRLVVVAGVLWGAGDFATLLIDVGHDVRATRVLLGRQAAHQSPDTAGASLLAPSLDAAAPPAARLARATDRERRPSAPAHGMQPGATP